MEIWRQYAAVRGHPLHYLRAGTGSPVVLIHGLLGGSFCWRFNVPVLAQRYTSLAVGLPGFGESITQPGLDCGVEAQGLPLRFLLEATGPRTVGVVAYSCGA